MTTELNFTQEAISKIISHKTKQEVYVDTKEQGLILIASPGKNNTKVFYLRKTVDGTYRTIKLGKFPYMSVAEARNKAIELKAQIASGINPIEKLAIPNNQIDNESTESTFKEFFDRYIEEHCKRVNRGWKNDVAQMNRCGRYFYDIKISTITRGDIQKVFNDVSNKRGPVAANRFYALLSAMFNKAIEWDVLVKTPTDAIEKHIEIPRERYVATKEEMSRLLKAIHAEPNKTMADFILMLLFTGARRGNVESMKWQDINFENTTWSIPARFC